jgi:hypothetical protein
MPDDAARGTDRARHGRVAAHAPEPIEPPKRPDLSPEEQSAFDNALRSGIEQKDNRLIDLALKNGADPNILMFAGIAYQPSLVKNFADPQELDAVHAHAMETLSDHEKKRRGSPRSLFYSESDFDQRYRQELAEIQALQEKYREDYNRGYEWLQLSIKSGANVNATNPAEKDPGDGQPRQYPAIHCAYHNFRTDISDFLVAQGAAVDAPSPANNSPLMRAVARGQPGLVRYYLSKGGDPLRRCYENDFPLQVLQASDKFTSEQKAQLLKLMMEHVQPTRPNPTSAGDFNAASANVGLQHDVEINKPLVLKSSAAKPARRFEL